MALTQEAAWEAMSGYGIAVVGLQPLEGGHINAAWRVTSRGGGVYFLQRLNSEVFPRGDAVMRNLVRVTTHLQQMVVGLPDAGRRALRLRARSDGLPGWRDASGAWWRLFDFIAGARSAAPPLSLSDAEQVGRAFGTFQRQLREYRGSALEETIPGFHDTASRYAAMEAAAVADLAGRADGVRGELGFARDRFRYAAVLPPLLESGALPTRIVHNDAKAENVLLGEETGEALAVVDLDTVMPGTLLHDVGDLIRSVSSPTGEDERQLSRIEVSLPHLRSLAGGYLGECGPLTEAERACFVFAGLLITYEQGLRFLTDHLAGDRYYRISRAGQNLDRARAQFRLLESLEQRRAELEGVVAGLAP